MLGNPTVDIQQPGVTCSGFVTHYFPIKRGHRIWSPALVSFKKNTVIYLLCSCAAAQSSGCMQKHVSSYERKHGSCNIQLISFKQNRSCWIKINLQMSLFLTYSITDSFKTQFTHALLAKGRLITAPALTNLMSILCHIDFGFYFCPATVHL